MRFIYTIVTNALALFVVSLLIPNFIFTGGVAGPLLAGIIITLLNTFARPIMNLLSFPLIFLSGGLFLIIVNALILYFTSYIIAVMDIAGVSLKIEGALTYVLAAVIFGLANWFIHWFFKE